MTTTTHSEYRDEPRGAVVVEWVALTAAAIGLSLGLQWTLVVAPDGAVQAPPADVTSKPPSE